MEIDGNLQSFQMKNVMFYIVFSKHTDFLTCLVLEMLKNVSLYYREYHNTIACIDNLKMVIEEKRMLYQDLVVVFFFFLSIDSKMRHWLLCVNQSHTDNSIRDKLLAKNIELVPGGKNTQSSNYNNPFMGQTVCFTPLHPHYAVPILLSISNELFFEHRFLVGTRNVYKKLNGSLCFIAYCV